MVRGAWQSVVHGVAKSWTQLSDSAHTHTHTHTHTQYSGEASQRRLALREELRVRIIRKKRSEDISLLLRNKAKPFGQKRTS